MLALAAEPRPPQHEHIQVAVVLEVGLAEVQAAEEAVQPRLLGAVCERAVGGVLEETHRAGGVPGRGQDVEIRIAVEVVDDRPAAQVDGVESELRRDVANRGNSSGERNADCGTRNRSRTPAGYSPSVIAATFKSQRAVARRPSSSVGLSSTSVKSSRARRDPSGRVCRPPPSIGSTQLSRVFRWQQFSTSPRRR